MKTLLLLTALCCVCLAVPSQKLQQRKKRDITAKQGCGGLLTDPQGVITSPNFPNSYPNNVYCVWKIITNSPIQITFTNFDLEGYMFNCVFDKLQVIDGATTTELCGQMLPLSIISTQNIVAIVFITDSSLPRTGFRLTYAPAPKSNSPNSAGQTTTTTTVTTPTTTTTTTTRNKPTTTTTPTTTSTTTTTTTTTTPVVIYNACGGSLTDAQGVITSPNFPNNYPNNALCQWTIYTTSRIKISFTNFDLEGYMYSCYFDKLQIIDGDFTYELCGQMLPLPMISTKTSVKIIFSTDGSLNRTGFRLLYAPA